MKLNLNPELTNFPSAHYIFTEASGPFHNTARKVWQDLYLELPKLDQSSIKGFMSLYMVEPEMIYRAGVIVDKKPENLPDALSYCHFEGGKYSKFVLTGSYDNLPEACGKVFEKVRELKLKVRKGFYVEHYLNSPLTTPEDQLLTEILIPTV